MSQKITTLLVELPLLHITPSSPTWASWVTWLRMWRSQQFMGQSVPGCQACQTSQSPRPSKTSSMAIRFSPPPTFGEAFSNCVSQGYAPPPPDPVHPIYPSYPTPAQDPYPRFPLKLFWWWKYDNWRLLVLIPTKTSFQLRSGSCKTTLSIPRAAGFSWGDLIHLMLQLMLIIIDHAFQA